MNKSKIIFWIATTIIFLWCGVMSLVFFGSEEQRMGMEHLGYPPHFTTMVSVFSIVGAVGLMLPATPSRLKEWAYFGFALNFIGAAVSTWAVDGLGFGVVFPLLFFIPLGASYYYFRKNLLVGQE
jgi:DoxX-like family